MTRAMTGVGTIKRGIEALRRRRVGGRRRGVAAVLAMVYLALFGTLAVGFYATVTTSAQVAHNDEAMAKAQMAAESGMDFMRYYMARLTIPPLTTEANLLNEAYTDLTALLNPTENLQGQTVYLDTATQSIQVPSGNTNYITLASGYRFRGIITRNDKDLVVKTIGISGEATSSSGCRAANELTFRSEQVPGNFFNYGMASRGSVSLSPSNWVIPGVPSEYASVLSVQEGLNPVTIGNGVNSSGIAGNITVMEGYDPVLLPPVSVGGETSVLAIQSNHVHHITPDEKPDFPVVDTAMFSQYATNTYTSGKSVYDNIVIPPNTNPTFAAGVTVRGVVYVQQPNVVTFNGNVTMHCVVVTEDKGVGTLGSNVIRLEGNGGAKYPLSTLPDEPQFEEVRELTGSFILAPGFDVALSGNFKSIQGDIAGDRVTLTGNTTSTITGNLMTLKPYPLTVGGSVQLTLKENADSKHSGLRFKERYIADYMTYREVLP